MNKEVLTQIGLNNTEIKVYFALLKLDKSTVGPIIKAAQIPDSKIYYILDTLKEKGLVNYIIKNNFRYYQANDPKNLLYIIDKKENDLNNLKLELKTRIIPEIEAKRKENQDKQEAFVYESIQGIKSAFIYMLDSLDKGDTYYVISHEDDYLQDKNVINFFSQHHKRRIERGIKFKILYPKEYESIIKKSYENEFMKNKEYKYVYSQKVPAGTYIFKNNVMTLVWGSNPTAFIIKSKVNYLHYKAFFDDLWNKTK